MRPSVVEIDLDAIRHNVSTFAKLVVPAVLCAVVKADAYGHGDVPVAEAALESGAAWLGVALLEEGVRLREAGITAPVLVLSEPDPEDAGEMQRWDLTPTVYRESSMRALASSASRSIGVHIKVDTGMHRVGVSPNDLPGLVEAASAYPNVSITGLWTHFAVADEDAEFTSEQIRRFHEATAGMEVAFRHLANTAGAVLFPQAGGNMVRVGIGIYGIHPCDATKARIGLRPAMRILSRVSYLQRLPAGERPSYGRIRPLAAASTVATIPIGYADGMPRLLGANGGEVLIGGRRYPLAGRPTMDQIMIDVGDDPVAVGDEVVVLGRQGNEEITTEEWAAKAATIPYEIVCRIGPRMPRRYLE